MYKGLYSRENMTKPPKKSYFEIRIPSVAIARKTPKANWLQQKKGMERFTGSHSEKCRCDLKLGDSSEHGPPHNCFPLSCFTLGQSCNQGIEGGHPKLWIYRSPLWPTQHRWLLFPVVPEVRGLVFIAVAWVLSPSLRPSSQSMRCRLVRAGSRSPQCRGVAGVRWLSQGKPRCC